MQKRFFNIDRRTVARSTVNLRNRRCHEVCAMPVVSVASARIPYEQRGSGPGLLLVHGTGPGAEITWTDLAARFADERTVVMPDLSGSAPAEDDGGPITLEQLSDQLAAVATDAGAGPYDVVGFSLGSPTAVAFAAAHPQLVRRLVLIAGWSHPEDEQLRNFMTLWQQLGDDAEAFGRFSLLTGFSRPFLNALGREQVEGLVGNMPPTAATLRQINLNLRADVREQLPRIAAPTLTIGCSADQTVPVARTRELHEAIPGSTYAELESGHVVLFEQPEPLAELIRDFLDEPREA